MLSTIESVNNVVNNLFWGVPAMVCIIGVRTSAQCQNRIYPDQKISIRHEGDDRTHASEKDASDGAMTPFQAVCTALAATVGTGNIAGVAGAIAIGGPGQSSGCGYLHFLECVLNFQK